jgi:epoxyqueuosine reductase QueG
MISLAVLKNPKLTENEVLNYAQQRNLVEDVPLAIAKDTRWMRNYQIKLAIVSNPKTPLSVAINFLPHLRDNDLKILSRDKNVSSILSRAAHNTLLKRKK